MSEFHVQVNTIKNVQKHPNADTLSTAEINGYPVIFKTGDFNEGELAVHIPVDSIVPDKPEWAFLDGHFRIKAKKLRGVFSMGLVIKPKSCWMLGQNVQKELGIIKYDPEPEFVSKLPKPKKGWRRLLWRIKKFFGLIPNEGQNEKDPGFIPVYTDIEGYRKFKDVLEEGEEVVLTEKIHGQNYRIAHSHGRFWVGSHKMFKRKSKNNKWWIPVIQDNLEERLKDYEDLVFFGEIYGNVQDLNYGLKGVKIAFFDIYDIKLGRYLDYDAFKELCDKLKLDTVPVLYRGKWSKDLLKLAEGQTTLPNANHIREGFVVRPVKERWLYSFGRVILKMVGEGYLLRKQK
jgi:hypothetical protein